jgi:tetratricopeptide (TPR) repeat protein
MPGSEEMTTTPDRWQRLQQLFHEALARPEAGRHAWIDAACADDLALRDELRRLLAAEAHAEADIQHAIGDAAAQLVRAGRHERVGTRLGPWRLVAHHADGGMGAVYRAVRDDGRYDQQVAVKLLNPASDGAAAKARLEAERRILARLEHPHIARLLDGGSTNDGVPYLVMEFVDGQPIDAWCDIHGADTAMRLRLFVQVCRAVDHAHRNLVVHRDLKPSNILVDGEGRPRLLDFGIAKLVDEGSALTRTGERAFTPSHASPEQVTGGVVTTATDVYALGVLLYDLLTGRPPYGGAETPAAMLAREIVETEPPRPSTAVASDDSRRRLAAAGERGERLTPQRLARELAGDLDNIVLMALRKEPERRYASVAALADDVERYLADLPVRARPDTLGYRAAKFLRRHPVAVPASALALVLATGAAGTFTWRLAAERDRALAAEARATRVAAFTASVLRNTGADEGATREVPVQTLLEGAVKRVDDELASEPEVATRLRIALGDAIMSWGEYEKARLQFEAALATARTRGAIGERDAAEAMQLLGVATHELGQLERSLDWSRQAEVLFRRAGSVAEHASALGDVAMSLNALRRREEAEPVFREAIARLRQAHAGADHDDIAWMLNNLAWNLHARGRLDEAEPLYTEALGHAATHRRAADHAVADAEQPGRHLLRPRPARRGRAPVARGVATVRAGLRRRWACGGGARPGHGRAGRYRTRPLGRGRAAHGIGGGHQPAAARRAPPLDRRHPGAARYGPARAGRLDEAEHRLRQAVAIEREVLPPVHASHAHTRLALARVALARVEPAGAGSPAPSACCVRSAGADRRACPHPTACRSTRLIWSWPARWRCRGRSRQGGRSLPPQSSACATSCPSATGGAWPQRRPSRCRRGSSSRRCRNATGRARLWPNCAS